MNEIRLERVTPNVFAERGDLVSDVWQQELTLERGKTYLVEAASGTGKSACAPSSTATATTTRAASSSTAKTSAATAALRG